MYNSVIENNILRDSDLNLVAQLGVTCGKQPDLLPPWEVDRTWRELRVRLLRNRITCRWSLIDDSFPITEERSSHHAPKERNGRVSSDSLPAIISNSKSDLWQYDSPECSLNNPTSASVIEKCPAMMPMIFPGLKFPPESGGSTWIPLAFAKTGDPELPANENASSSRMSLSLIFSNS